MELVQYDNTQMYELRKCSMLSLMFDTFLVVVYNNANYKKMLEMFLTNCRIPKNLCVTFVTSSLCKGSRLCGHMCCQTRVLHSQIKPQLMIGMCILLSIKFILFYSVYVCICVDIREGHMVCVTLWREDALHIIDDVCLN